MHDNALCLKLLTILLLFLPLLAQNSWCNLTATNVLAVGTGSHSFFCSFQGFNIATTNSYITVAYSSNWAVGSFTGGNINDFCETGCTVGSVTPLANGPNNIRLNGLVPNAITQGYFSFRYTLNNIGNPGFRINQTITITLFTSADVTVATATVKIAINPAVMSCSASATNPVVGDSSSYTFTVNPGVILPSSGYMKISFPAVWRNSLSGPTLAFSSCSGGTISCAPPVSNVITATNVVSISSASTFSFTLANINNPGTEQTINDLNFTYFYSNNSQLSYCTVPITGLNPPALTGISFTVVGNVGMLSYSNILPTLATDDLLITLPPQVYVNNLLTTSVCIGACTNPVFPTPVIIGSNQISLSPYQGSVTTSISIQLNNLFLIKPATTANPTFALRRGTQRYSYSSCCSLFQNSTQALTLQAITLTNYRLKGSANYLITFVPTYYGIYYLIIDFGSGFSFNVSTVYPCYLSTLTTSSQMVCTATALTQITVTLTNPSSSFASLLGFAASYTLVINGLTNPSQLTASISISSHQLANNQLQYSSSFTVNYIVARMVNAGVSVSSYQVGALASYTFNINNTNTLLPSSILYIYFPPSIRLGSSSCTTNSVTSFCMPNSTYVKFTLPSSTIPPTLLSSYALTVTNVVNPNSLMPSASFGLQLESGGAIVQVIYDGIVVEMSTLATFTPFSITPSSNKVAALSSYTINFGHSLTFLPTDVIKLSFQLPPELVLASCTACTSLQAFTITSSTTSVTISGIYNPQQVSTFTNIIVSLYVNGYLSIQVTASPITYNALNTLWSLKSDSVYLGDAVKLNFTIQTLPLNTNYFTVTIPSNYGLGTVTANSQGSISCTCNLMGRVLSCTSIAVISSANVTLIVKGLTNPVVTSSPFWKIQAYAAGSILISSQSSSIMFNAPCGTNCRDCINPTYCLSCYGNPLVNNAPYLSQTTNLCVNSCGSNQYLQVNMCFTCNSACLTCSISATNCTSCTVSTFLYAGNCLASCPKTYYSSAQTCILCSNNCATCSSLTVCLTCSNGCILQMDSSCQISCPSGQYNQSNVCTFCPSNCQTCNPSACLTCSPTFLLTITFTFPVCVGNCPTNTYISANGSVCETCKSPCLTCSVRSNNCTSCQIPSSFALLSNFECIGTCPNQTYADELNQCQSCQSPCFNCSSVNKCTSCVSPYLYYSPNNQCLSSCFSNTINVSGNCVQCTSNCLTCSGTTNTCTSCKQSYFLLGTTCASNCNPPYYITGNICSLCYLPCQHCTSNPYQCLDCVTNYRFFWFKCYSPCPVGTYAINVTNCTLCSPPCYQCSGTASTCTACFSGSYLFNNNCYSPCPPTYFPINNTCELCQPQCFTCNHTLGDQCSTCKNASYFFNPITYHCTVSCITPYYSNTGTKTCQPCQLPCKSCASTSTTCSACYIGYFLKNQQCVTLCGNGYYSNNTDLTCSPCPSLCATCDIQKCFTCNSGSYFYDGMCYSVCPSQAPHIYGLYCRNCLKNDCIKCNIQGACTMCMPGRYNYNGDCVSSCPAYYEPDFVTNSHCVLKAEAAYFNYIKALESSKVWLVPSSIILLLSLPMIFFASAKFFFLVACLAAPQLISLLGMTAIYMREWKLLSIPIFPFWMMYALGGIYIIFSLVYTLIVKNSLQKEDSFKKWLQYGSNKFRYGIVIICSCFSKQILFILFSGLFQLPFTSFRFKPSKGFYLIHTISLLPEIAALSIAFLLAIYENTLQYNYKIFYSSLDIIIVFSISIIYQIIFLLNVQNQPSAASYSKYILPFASNRTLPAVSIQNDIPEQTPHNNLHRSGSDDNLLQSQQMKNVQFLSVFDPQDYYDQTPNMTLEAVPQGIKGGKFRKKNKKKRGERRKGKLDLDVIDEQEELVDQKRDPKNKKQKQRKKDELGGLKNYLYVKKPKQKKVVPGVVFKEHENQIMQKIKQKQSQFDSITQKDIIFQDYNEEQDSSDDNYHIQQQSRRALHKPSFENYFNLNYASKQHLNEQL